MNGTRKVTGGLEEKRKAKRVTCLVEAECRGKTMSRFIIRDISVTGAFIETINVFPVGAVLTLRFRLGATELRVWGEVRSRRAQGMGGRFLNLSAEEMDLIESLIRENSSLT